MFKLKHIALAEAVLIIVLLGMIAKMAFLSPNENFQKKPLRADREQLLSSRVYSKILEPGSFLLVDFTLLKDRLTEYITENKYDISVYVENLKSGSSFGINERKAFLPASLNKVLLAILVMRKVERKELNLDAMMDIHESDRTDTAGALYLRPEKRLPLKDLLKYMLNESDNTAFNILRRYVDTKDTSFIIKYTGYPIGKGIGVMNLGTDSENSRITPKSMYNIFSSLYLSTILQPQHSEFILSALTDTAFDIEKLAQLPDDVTVAHKFGVRYTSGEKLFHDCGIMYIHSKEMRLFYCIMTENLDKDTATEALGEIVRAVYFYRLDARNKFDHYK